MKDEVEEFLRRVAQLRAQAEAQAKGQVQPPQRPAAPAQRPPAPAQRLGPAPGGMPSRQAAAPTPLVAEVVDAELAESGDRIGRHVAEDLRGAMEIAEHARHLGDEVDAAQGKMNAHMHEVFDHQLGQLKQTAPQGAAGPAETSTSEVLLSEMLRMLRSPQSARDAIILSEVLKRPDHQW